MVCEFLDMFVHIPYSGLFSKQKFSQERQNLNFEDYAFLRVFEFESKMAFTISSIVRGYHVYKDI